MTNQLIHETSPYLLQHADNPVNWHAWNPEALRLARDQDKPVLLSIGYSACHWCHVMAHESFEDAEVAALMNEHFVNIKVDREERPDLDQIYQTAHAMLTRRHGGWPLTMFLTPDGTPFFGGTYFPKFNSHNLPAFPDVLKRIAQVYVEHRTELNEQNKQLLEALATSVPANTLAASLNGQPLERAVAQLSEGFDKVNGGFGGAPKFPLPAELDFLLRRSHTGHDENVREMVLYTLRQMALGGIYDQLGGGFCRYSVDERWEIPHFEKMLYDNGLLLALYSDAWQASGEALFSRIVEETAGWVMREMQAPDGGYYSSLDADSEHEEGKFYVWQREEVRKLLSDDEYAVAELHFGLRHSPNFEQDSWHLRMDMPADEIAQHLHQGSIQVEEQLHRIRQKLFNAREQRVHAGRDEKILASWNGLMIAGMARAARAFGRKDWLRSAQQAMDFVRSSLWHDGKLLATCRDGKAHLNAYLDDHAFLLQAALELLQAEFRREDLEFAQKLAKALLTRFEDRESGGFFFTSHDHEDLIQRNKPGPDNAIPSGNGVAAQALQRMAALTGNMEYAAAAERCLKLFFPALQETPGYHASLCSALMESLHPPSLLVLNGEAGEVADWCKGLWQRYLPEMLLIVPPGNTAGLPEPLVKQPAGQVTAWLCTGTQCLPPIAQFDELLSALA